MHNNVKLSAINDESNLSKDVLSQEVQFNYLGLFKASLDGDIIEEVDIIAPRIVQLAFNGVEVDSEYWIKKVVKVVRTSFEPYYQAGSKGAIHKSSLRFQFVEDYLDDGSHYYFASILQRLNPSLIFRGLDSVDDKELVRCLIKHGSLDQQKHFNLVRRVPVKFGLTDEVALRYLNQFAYAEYGSFVNVEHCFPWIESLNETQIRQSVICQNMVPPSPEFFVTKSVSDYLEGSDFYEGHFRGVLCGTGTEDTTIFGGAAAVLELRDKLVTNGSVHLTKAESALNIHLSHAVQVIAMRILNGADCYLSDYAYNNFIQTILDWPRMLEMKHISEALSICPESGSFMNDMFIGLCMDESDESYELKTDWYGLPLLAYMIAHVINDSMVEVAGVMLSSAPESMLETIIDLSSLPESLRVIKRPETVRALLESLVD